MADPHLFLGTDLFTLQCQRRSVPAAIPVLGPVSVLLAGLTKSAGAKAMSSVDRGHCAEQEEAGKEGAGGKTFRSCSQHKSQPSAAYQRHICRDVAWNAVAAKRSIQIGQCPFPIARTAWKSPRCQ